VLDLRFVREHAGLVKENNALRRVDAEVDRLVEMADRRGALNLELEDVRRRQNETAERMKSAKSQTEREPLIQLGKELKVKAADLEKEVAGFEEPIQHLLKGIPNLTHPEAPRGEVDVTLREVGAKPTFDFKPLDHVTLCEKHGLADFEAASRVSGSHFYYLIGDGALLELALIQFAIQKLVRRGYTPVLTPDLAKERILDGTGYIPRGPETQIYKVEGHDLGLIATAEITIAGMFVDQIVESEKLPLKFAGLSHCFRTEAGAAGRATKGLYRVHQFTKVEMFAFCRPEESEGFHREILGIEEEIFQELGIPYRVLDIRAGDLGGPAYRKYDLEAWMPGRGEAGEWGEITSTSNCTDYQARRLNIRHRAAGQKGTQFLHMLNGTAIAVGRAIVALLENHQRADGSIKVPAPLVPWLGKDVIG
jgi:seryl-tRNA synthetase